MRAEILWDIGVCVGEDVASGVCVQRVQGVAFRVPLKSRVRAEMHVHRTEASPGDVCRGFKVGLGSRIAFTFLARAGIPVSNWIQLGGPPSFDVAVFGCQPLGVDLGWLGSIEVRAGVAACCSLEVRGGTTECPAGCTTAAWAAGCHGERSRSQLFFQ